MRQKVSFGLAILGLAVIVYALTMNGQHRLATMTLGVIVACGGGLMILSSSKSFRDHRAMSGLITVLFVLVVVGYLLKITIMG